MCPWIPTHVVGVSVLPFKVFGYTVLHLLKYTLCGSSFQSNCEVNVRTKLPHTSSHIWFIYSSSIYLLFPFMDSVC